MKLIIAALLLAATGQAQTVSKPGTEIITEMSLSVAKKVCADNPTARVWVFGDRWAVVACVQLESIFSLDRDNKFDALVPLMQEIHDEQKKPEKKVKP